MWKYHCHLLKIFLSINFYCRKKKRYKQFKCEPFVFLVRIYSLQHEQVLVKLVLQQNSFLAEEEDIRRTYYANDSVKTVLVTLRRCISSQLLPKTKMDLFERCVRFIIWFTFLGDKIKSSVCEYWICMNWQDCKKNKGRRQILFRGFFPLYGGVPQFRYFCGYPAGKFRWIVFDGLTKMWGNKVSRTICFRLYWKFGLTLYNKKHCQQRNNGPKALTTLTHSTVWQFKAEAEILIKLQLGFVRQRARNTCLWQIHVTILTNPCTNFDKFI